MFNFFGPLTTLFANVRKLYDGITCIIILVFQKVIKSTKAARTKASLKLMANAKRVILLSGTPALSRPSELFSQIQAVNPTLFVNFSDYGNRYCDPKESRFGID